MSDSCECGHVAGFHIGERGPCLCGQGARACQCQKFTPATKPAADEGCECGHYHSGKGGCIVYSCPCTTPHSAPPATKPSAGDAQCWCGHLMLGHLVTGECNAKGCACVRYWGEVTATATAPDRYASLRSVLARAVEQAEKGKGHERHDRGEPFEEQDICTIGRDLGSVDFELGQARKKAQESKCLPPDRAVAELLGAIVYLAAAVILLEEKR